MTEESKKLRDNVQEAMRNLVKHAATPGDAVPMAWHNDDCTEINYLWVDPPKGVTDAVRAKLKEAGHRLISTNIIWSPDPPGREIWTFTAQSHRAVVDVHWAVEPATK